MLLPERGLTIITDEEPREGEKEGRNQERMLLLRETGEQRKEEKKTRAEETGTRAIQGKATGKGNTFVLANLV